jgi:hypothetical protein
MLGEPELKKLLPMAVMLALFVSISVAEDHTYEVAGVFSFNYSDGWTKGPRKGGNATELDWLVNPTVPSANFHAVLARADFSYDDWIRRSIKTASADRVLVSKGDFVTTSGEKGYKLVWAIKSPNGAQYVTNNYLFHGKGDTQIQLSGTIDAADADKFAPIFDGFAKSFTLVKSK